MKERGGWVVVFLVACSASPPRDPQRVYGEAAHACATRYVAPKDATIEITVLVADEMQEDFNLSAMCVRLDEGAVMLTDATEVRAHQPATRRIRVRPGAHEMSIVADWHGRSAPTYTFEVKTKHPFEAAAAPMQIEATAYETARDVPLQDRPRIAWKDRVIGR